MTEVMAGMNINEIMQGGCKVIGSAKAPEAGVEQISGAVKEIGNTANLSTMCGQDFAAASQGPAGITFKKPAAAPDAAEPATDVSAEMSNFGFG